jgi:hypothetical protein
MCGPQTVHSKQTHLHLQKPGLSKRERMTRTLKRYTFTAMLLIPVAHPRRLAPAVSAASVGEARVAHRRPLVPPRVTPSAPYPTSRRVAVQIGGGGRHRVALYASRGGRRIQPGVRVRVPCAAACSCPRPSPRAPSPGSPSRLRRP